MKRNAILGLFLFFCSCHTEIFHPSVAQTNRQDSLRCHAFLNSIDTITDYVKRESVIKNYTATASLFSDESSPGKNKISNTGFSYDYTMQRKNISTIEGPGQMYDCRLDEEDSTLSPFQLYVDSFTSKRVNWEIASQDQCLWTVTSQEKCYFQCRNWGSKIAMVRHIESKVNSVLPATWEEKYSYVKSFGLGIEARCGGVLTVNVLGLPGESFVKRYELLKSVTMTKKEIEMN